MTISSALRSGADVLFAQAFKEGQSEQSPPYDSVLMFEGETLPLYLREGTYKLVAYDADGLLFGREIVAVTQ